MCFTKRVGGGGGGEEDNNKTTAYRLQNLLLQSMLLGGGFFSEFCVVSKEIKHTVLRLPPLRDASS